LAFRITRDRGLAEDAVQDAFLSVWRSAGSFDSKRGAPRSWLLTLAHHRAVDVVQRTVRAREQPSDQPSEPASSAAAAAELKGERRRVCAALAGLPFDQRQALELGYYGGLSQSEIAGQLDVPIGTVKSRTYTALASLRDALSADAA
jgi:RNA polymerase sigma factor (sigma-70 family)